MSTNKDNINTTVFAFEYESENVAARSNNLIENNFDTKIFPEIEKVAAEIFPNGMLVKLNALEINIGEINEMELENDLAHRVKESLENALRKLLKTNQFRYTLKHELILETLEGFLLKGYLPSWITKGQTFEQLIKKLLNEPQTDLKKLFQKYKSNEAVMARLRQNLDSKTFGKLHSEIDSKGKETVQELPIKDKLQIKSFPKDLVPFNGEEAFKNKLINMESLENNNDRIFDEIGTEIRIYNAGMIILWPFLTRFFEQLSLMENGEFVNNENKNRAVYLLQNVVFDRIDFPEYELALNKLFVGLPLSGHLSPISELTADEKNLSESLLNGVIANWDKVKSSSTAAIRDTFLQREGILKIREESIVLVIENKGVDVLLSSLPWNISLIKLPWMQKPIHVEWI